MRSARIALVLVVAAGVLGLALTGGSDERQVVQTSGVLTIAPVAALAPGTTACQRPVVTTDQVDAVALSMVATNPAPVFELRVTDTLTHRLLASGPLRGRLATGGRTEAVLDQPVPANRSVAICVHERGTSGGATILGDDGNTDLCRVAPGSLGCEYHFAHPISLTARAYVNGAPVPGTMDIALLRRPSRSVLGQVGAMMRRASTFRPGFVGEGLWWVLLVLGVLGVPAALWWGLRTPIRNP